MKECCIFIYLTTCYHYKYYGMKYIGSHKGTLDDSYIGSGSLLRKVVKEIGREYFEREILEVLDPFLSRHEINKIEEGYLRKYNVGKNENYFNLKTDVSGTTRNTKWYHCPKTGERLCSEKPIPGYKLGTNSHSTRNKVWAYCDKTKVTKMFDSEDDIPYGWTRGNLYNKNRLAYNKGVPLPENHKLKLSDEWEVEFPDGTVKTIINMLEFCREYKLNPSTMSAVARGKRRHYKNYRCKKLTNNRNVDYEHAEFEPCTDFSSKANKRGKNGNATKIEYDGILYDCIEDAKDATGLSYYLLRKYGDII